MSVKTLNRILPCLIAVTIPLMMFTVAVDAAENSRASRTAKTRADKRKGMPQNAAAAASGLDKYLEEIFNSVNLNQQPSEETIAKASIHLKGCRLFLKKISDAEVGKYYMLTAWVNHFNGDSKNALRAIKMADKRYGQNFDVRASDTVIAVLTENKPSDPSKRKKTLEGKKILDLDTTSLRNDLLYRKVTPFKASCLNSTTFNYTPGQAALCVMFWQLKEDTALDSITNPDGTTTITDPNGNPITVKPKKPTYGKKNQRPKGNGTGDRMEYDMMMEYGGPGRPGSMYDRGSAAKAKPTTFEEEMSAFGDLFLDTYGDENLKFLAINTDRAAELSTTVDKLAENRWLWAQAMAKLPNSGTEQFADISVKKPLFVIIDKTGTIKYAGSIKGFLPKMVLAKIASVKISSDYQAPQTDPVEQAPPVQPVVPAVSVKPVRKNPPKELDLADQIWAEDQLNWARGLFLHKKQTLLTPKQGIDMCREVIRKYPDSKYADEARTILREHVDPRYRKKYDITDEELGL